MALSLRFANPAPISFGNNVRNARHVPSHLSLRKLPSHTFLGRHQPVASLRSPVQINPIARRSVSLPHLINRPHPLHASSLFIGQGSFGRRKRPVLAPRFVIKVQNERVRYWSEVATDGGSGAAMAEDEDEHEAEVEAEMVHAEAAPGKIGLLPLLKGTLLRAKAKIVDLIRFRSSTS